MKSIVFLFFSALVIAVIWVAFPYLDDRDEDFENRLVGAVNMAEQVIDDSLERSARVYKPEFEPVLDSNLGTLSGILVIGSGESDAVELELAAQLRSLCPDHLDPGCWHVESVEIDGQVMDLSSPVKAYADGDADTIRQAPVKTLAKVDEALRSTLPIQKIPRDMNRLEALGIKTIAQENGQASVPPSKPGLGVDSDADRTGDAHDVAEVPAIPEEPRQASVSPSDSESGVDSEPGQQEVARVAPDVQAGLNTDDTFSSAEREQELVWQFQEDLSALGYDPGPADGVFGPKTAIAFEAYQRDLRDGLLSVAEIVAPAHLDELRERVIFLRHIQQILRSLGYDPGPVDGVVGSKTVTAIEAYQRDQSLSVDGIATPALLNNMRAQVGVKP